MPIRGNQWRHSCRTARHCPLAIWDYAALDSVLHALEGHLELMNALTFVSAFESMSYLGNPLRVIRLILLTCITS